MKYRIDITTPSPKGWIQTVMKDFNSFIIDHANCERKASAMAMSFVAKYPDRLEIIPEMIETGIEELEHFRDVYAVMEKKGVTLTHEMEEDNYMKQLLAACRTGRDERFLDRMLIASIVECRGAERFRLVYENIDFDEELKEFYHKLWASEAKHSEVFIRLALKYFSEEVVYKRLNELNDIEGKIILSLPLRAALH